KLAADAKATAMKLDGDDGDEYWVGLHNFYVITRYNHSAMYAMAAHQLSQMVAAKYHSEVASN
ncbi:MAG: lytic murein transglycosylase, partial [Spongiibacter sp.]